MVQKFIDNKRNQIIIGLVAFVILAVAIVLVATGKINLRNIPFKESFAGHTAEYKVNALTLESALKTAAILKRSFFFGRILP